MKISCIFVAVLGWLVIAPGWSMADDVTIIVNSSVPVSALSQKDIRNYYLGRKTTWKDGSKIVFVVQKNSEIHDRFLKDYIGKTAAQFDTFWKKQIFTGNGAPPQSFSSDQELVQFVAQTPGALGYVSSGTHTANVKTIAVE